MEAPRFCPNCGTPVEPGYKFCPNCGFPLRAEEPRKPRDFTLQDVPRSPETRVGEKFTVFIEGVSKDLRFDGSGVQKFKKVPLEEALRLFSTLPRSYPEGFTPDEKTKLLIFQVGTVQPLSIGLRLDKAGAYDILGRVSRVIYGRGLFARFWIKDVDYDTACEAIRRYYTEPDFVENVFKAQERWVQEEEKGKYMAKIPCAVPIHHKGEFLERFLYGGLYAMGDGLALWPTSLVSYEPKRLPDDVRRMPFEPVKIKGLIRLEIWMADGLCHLPFHAVKKAKVKVKDAKMEMKYVDPRGKKRDIEFYFLMKEDVPKFCQTITPYLADRLKIK